MPRHVLQLLLDRMPAGTPPDGPDGPTAQLEGRIAELLGTETALFFPSGTMAQQIALRVHAARRGRMSFAAHPQNHLVVWEEQGYTVVHGLAFHPVGDRNSLLTLADLSKLAVKVGAVLLELPQRDIGGQLPPWDALVEQVAWAREHGAAVHMDGARLWEAQTFYQRPFAEIAGLFDTVYVSLYKALHGARGAVLAGPRDIIAEAAVWRTRLGGSIPDAWPLAAIAMLGLEDLLPRMPIFRAHAIAIAAAINADGTAHTVPEVPQTPMFHVHLPASKEAVERAADAMIAERGIQLFSRARSSPDSHRCSFEVSISENAMEFTGQEVVQLIRELLQGASDPSRST